MTNKNNALQNEEIKGLVSVVIPGYKRTYILETIESVLAQTYSDIEIIVIDDGSPNNLKSVLSDLIKAEKIKYIFQQNQKMAAARNNGISHAKGEFIAFIDDDDLWEEDKIEKQVKAFDNESVGLVYSFAEGFNKEKIIQIENFELIFRGRIYCEIFLQDFIANSSVVVRSECFRQVGLFNSSREYFGVDDCDMWTRITHQFDAEVVPEKLTRIRIHDEQFSSNSGVMRDNDLQVRKNLMTKLEVPNFYKRKYFQRAYFDAAYSLRSSNKWQAFTYNIKSFIAYPALNPLFAILKLPFN